MEQEHSTSDFEQQILKWQKSQRRGRIAAGLMVILFGTLFLLNRLDFGVPGWAFSWPMILIAIGFVVTVKHKFKKLFGYVIAAIGLIFLLQSWYPKDINKEIIFPVVVIDIGVAMVFKKRHRPHSHHHKRFSREHWKRMHEAERCGHGVPSEEDFLDATNVFGGIKKNVVSQQFKGADVTLFGGTDINLTNANFEEKVVLDITCVFGGTTITVPTDWKVNSEITTVFGGVEDKRPLEYIGKGETNKILVLQGTCFFGGIEINSFAQ